MVASTTHLRFSETEHPRAQLRVEDVDHPDLKMSSLQKGSKKGNWTVESDLPVLHEPTRNMWWLLNGTYELLGGVNHSRYRLGFSTIVAASCVIFSEITSNFDLRLNFGSLEPEITMGVNGVTFKFPIVRFKSESRLARLDTFKFR